MIITLVFFLGVAGVNSQQRVNAEEGPNQSPCQKRDQPWSVLAKQKSHSAEKKKISGSRSSQ
ncbi:MAG: hypothetical protein ACK51Y_01755, partial [Burkholderiales bacterium]